MNCNGFDGMCERFIADDVLGRSLRIAYFRGMAETKYLVVIGGPTASGKTPFAVQVATHFHTEIISCDSRQFYQEMRTGTARPSASDMQGIPHHFVGHRSVQHHYSVGDFEKEALALLARLHQQHQVVVAVGGSGLYIKALCEGLDRFPDVPESVRADVRRLYVEHGLGALQQALALADPVYFDMVDRNNPHRLIRALEVCRATGQPFSTFRQGQTAARNFTPIYILLDLPRSILYDRINRRVDAMLAAGLLEEARTLYVWRHLSALQTVGYQEVFDYFDEKITLPEAIENIKQHTRNYAKRQLTWWRRDGFWQSVHPEQLTDTIAWLDAQIAQ
ncbi:MAG TPA: tRNA (adenosine(37)-N6)-dimethylallyltransferase MiaA [Saprospiraceae bacterium]|nr:tRNA (adenosine(37)-N6)-dimethylallyltransferase MiaA [Saprospiraceae bacterium]HMP13103.1 tRNA (adenosine(37)-N6)-dimethylallyltransferase MiaA [Saprospiraceae bacterium]